MLRLPHCELILLAFLATGLHAQVKHLSVTAGRISITAGQAATSDAYAHYVALSWTGSAGATDYKVYRGTVTGGPYATVACPRVSNACCYDTNVQSGQTYFYVATAFNASGESTYSNEATATIP